MSGKPSPDGVTEFTIFLNQMSGSITEATHLKSEIEARKTRLVEVELVYVKAKQNLFDLMKKMDVASNGNFGWEERMSWFLIELHRQLVKL